MGFGKNFRWLRDNKLIFPLACLLGFALIIVTVSGNDSVSGTFLGLGLLATIRRNRAVNRGQSIGIRGVAQPENIGAAREI
jgi:hypothetical protein